jgi:hypothetical protein
MDAATQALARTLLPARQEHYDLCVASLAHPRLSVSQRLSRQQNVACALRALNCVRVAAGLEELVGPPLLSLDELIENQREALSHLQAA